MSGIGGMVALDRGQVRQDYFMDMSRSLLLRGADQRGAYWNDAVGLFCGQKGKEDFQPAMTCHGGTNYVAVVDGMPQVKITGVKHPTF